jgi:hypothetical protein
MSNSYTVCYLYRYLGLFIYLKIFVIVTDRQTWCHVEIKLSKRVVRVDKIQTLG